MPCVDKIISLHPISNYKILIKHPIYEKDSSVEARFKRLKEEFESIGMRRTVEAVILTHVENIPHVLLLMIGTKFTKMPGGELNVGEDEVEGLKRLLNETFGEENEIQCNWSIKHIVGTWWRPNCETCLYPYCPPHVKDPKERKTLFLVQSEPNSIFAVPKNYKLVAAPLDELYGKHQKYGQIISTLPHMLSQFQFQYL